MVGDIAVASNEQATGIAQVDQGISQVSQVVQTNSATAQQSAAASEELSEQAGLLKERVVQFQLKDRKGSPDVVGYGSPAAGNYYSAVGEAAAAGSSYKPKISLDDDDFGKY